MIRYFLVFAFMTVLAGASFAQESVGSIETIRAQAAEAETAFWKKVDASTDWGKWLVEVKPYWDKISEATMVAAASAAGFDPTGMSEQAAAAKGNEIALVFYKALQGITPPEELKVYHAKIMATYAELTKSVPADHEQLLQKEEATKKLSNDAVQELAQVLSRHQVPQDIIEEFMKKQ